VRTSISKKKEYIMKTRLYRSAARGVFCSLLLLFALLFPLLPVAAAKSRQGAVVAAPLSRTDIASIDAFVSSQMQAQRIPGLSLGIMQGTHIVHLHGFGTANATGRLVIAQTPFIIGSMSKSFTALAVMQLVEAGKVELDAPVQRYLPWFRVADPVASARITVR
jgi:CubicO group peptidase (beta-lactamase class C family)